MFFISGASALAAPALWLVQSPAGKVYLFGTVHLLRDGTPWRSPELEAAMKASQDLYLEIADPANMSAALSALVKAGFDRDHPLSTKISKSDVALLGEAAKQYGFGSEATFEPMRPWLAFMFLSLMPEVRSGYSAANGVDVQIRKVFVGAGKPVHGFETAAMQVHIFADMPEADQVALLDAELHGLNKKTNTAELDRIVSTWLSGDENQLDALLHTNGSSNSAFYRRLLTDRNEAWAKALAERLKQPGTSFVSVGAAHLAGPDGVPELLSRMGFTVTRVAIAQTTPLPSPVPSAEATGTPAPSAEPAGTAAPSPAASETPVPQTLTPPPGWKKQTVSFKSGVFSMDQMWVAPNRGGIILTGHLSIPGMSSTDLDSLDSLFHQGLVAGAGSKGTVQPSARVKICNGKQDGTYSKVRMSAVNEDVVLAVSDRGYLAEYTRRKDVPDDPAAIRSLMSLCAP